MRLAKKIAILGILFTSCYSQAAVTITGVSGASNFIPSSGKIFGGTAGTCAVYGSTVCDSCEGTDFTQPCNQVRVHPGLVLTISVNSTTAFGKVLLTETTGATPIPLIIGSSTTTAINQTGTLQILWSSLCSATVIVPDTAADVNCLYNGTANLKIGIDKDGNNNLSSTGDDAIAFQIRLQNTIGSAGTHADGCSTATAADPLCGFSVLPGDEKAYVVSENLRYVDGYPNGSGISYSHLRLYFIERPPTFDPTIYSGLQMTREKAPVDLATSGSGSEVNLVNDVVGGLNNGFRYYFLMASVDEAMNEGFYSDQTTLSERHTALPDEVFGLLSEDFQCFVATAAYGSSLEKEVITLRRFRGYLLENYRNISFPFVKSYYKYSPPLAQFISQHDSLKAFSRAALWPAVWFAQSSLVRGLPLTILISIFPFFILVFIYRRVRR